MDTASLQVNHSDPGPTSHQSSAEETVCWLHTAPSFLLSRIHSETNDA
jgi:hypothetical protein